MNVLVLADSALGLNNLLTELGEGCFPGGKTVNITGSNPKSKPVPPKGRKIRHSHIRQHRAERRSGIGCYVFGVNHAFEGANVVC